MSRSPVTFILLAGAACAPAAFAQAPSAPSAQGLADVRAACDSDVQSLCAGVPQGGGRIIACLKQHKEQVSPGCKQAIVKALQGPGAAGSAGGPEAAAAANAGDAAAAAGGGADRDAGSSAAPAASSPATANHHAGAAPAAGNSAAGSDRYFLMKQVKIIDQGLGQGRPAYDLMIPTTWDFKGWVNVGVAEGGCFADWFAVVGDAKTADNSIELQILPQYTWQYVDDPTAQRHLQQENQQAAQVGMKPCPVRAPVRAADFLRQDMIAKYRKGKTVVSVDPFPELDQIARHRLGLPPDNTGGNSAVQTDAARARLAYDDENGRPVEEWLTAVIVVRTLPTGGRGAAYDWHAIMVMNLRTPKGQLDANDKLFKLIASTIRPEPEWQTWSNGVIASMYQKKQLEEAKQSAMIAQFQNQVAQTINGVVARQQQGANNAAFGADQLIRGVQTFRDPTSGATFELSNMYDHAWLNGSNQYLMSDDPNFNPNGNLSGNWTALQPVRPAP